MRLFISVSTVTTFVAMSFGGSLFCVALAEFSSRTIVQRILFIGWTKEAEKLVAAMNSDRNHPYEIVGYLATNCPGSGTGSPFCSRLGSPNEMEE